jgi:predicted DNA-binding protein (MmcQ/YjbR family)
MIRESRRDRVIAACGAKPGSAECDPHLALGLRARYAAVTPGYHLNKRHWNTVELDDSVPEPELLELIDHSYDLVAARLTRAQRSSLGREDHADHD